MNIYKDIKFIKSSKASSRSHVMKSDGKAVCDSNIDNLQIIESTIGSEICINCLRDCFNRFGGQITAGIELAFYFNQYTGGSNFLDSIHERVKNGLTLSPKQYEASLKTFRGGSFIYSKKEHYLNGLYER